MKTRCNSTARIIGEFKYHLITFSLATIEVHYVMYKIGI